MNEASFRPKLGWVRAVRETLGMTASAFAKRLGMTNAGVSKLESAEATDAITLASLRKLAHALDCELQYALIPKTSLTQQLQERAQAVAKKHLLPIAHSMALEEQAVKGASNKLKFNLVVLALLEGSCRELSRD